VAGISVGQEVRLVQGEIRDCNGKELRNAAEKGFSCLFTDGKLRLRER
jgi:hypothetical protein